MVKKNRISIPSARKQRQKYVSDEYRNKYTKIVWQKKKKRNKLNGDV